MKEAAAGRPVACFSAFTSCQEFSASMKLMYPGRPFNTFRGSSPSAMKMRAGFWLGLQPYFSSNSVMRVILSISEIVAEHV